MYLVLADDQEAVETGNMPGSPPDGSNTPPGITRAAAVQAPFRSLIGSARFFVGFVLAGAILGVVGDIVLAALRNGTTVVWTERAMTWSWMLFAILGALVGATVALAVDAIAHRYRATS